jgi:hypothetical protein
VPVRRSREKDRELTRLVVSGHVLEEDMHGALEEFYNNQPTQLLLWDMSLAELWHITPVMVLDFVRKAVKLGAQRAGGRTAVLAPDDLQFDMGMMSQAFHSQETNSIVLRIFRSEEEALSWLTTEKIG